jgi:hypothetical protein
MTKSRRIEWAGHVARIETNRILPGFWRERLHWENIYIGGKIILK